ncbi:receptor-type protein kinase, putative [Bodo saltans]|uniref:Receptor-type protein kinase, putative n=1 Tax=Bodo saltans TaxID=75058 RepID=A0A0S4J9E7_BODSA|nr:receptor-type protein kinase, putative [Bodo saltans]|eukprot:CUG86750.1 receptor-type protein kinase, putative [Bodo saltans]
MKNLRHLAIGDCAIGDNGIAIISRLSKLRSLHIGCLNLSQYALIYIGTMSELEYLNLDHACRLTFKDMPRSIANLTKLTYLNLRMAMPRCHRRTHGGVEPMPASFRHLQFLNLDKCPLVGDWAAALALNTPVLKRLFLRNARGVCDPDLVHIATLSLLQHLDLRECFNVSLDGLAYLQALLNLKHLAFPMLADIASAEYSKLLNGFKSSSLATIQAPEKHDPIWGMPTEKSIDEVRLLVPQFVRVVGSGEEEFETWNHVKVPKAVHCNGDVWCVSVDRKRDSIDKGENNRILHL